MTDSLDPWKDPAWLEYAAYAREELNPMIASSMLGMAFVEGRDIDPKMACELGYLIMLDKPIIAMIEPGVKVPDKLVRVADEIVEMGDVKDPVFQKRLSEAIERVKAKHA